MRELCWKASGCSYTSAPATLPLPSSSVSQPQSSCVSLSAPPFMALSRWFGAQSPTSPEAVATEHVPVISTADAKLFGFENVRPDYRFSMPYLTTLQFGNTWYGLLPACHHQSIVFPLSWRPPFHPVVSVQIIHVQSALYSTTASVSMRCGDGLGSYQLGAYECIMYQGPP